MSFIVQINVLIVAFNFLSFCEPVEYYKSSVFNKRGGIVKACGSRLADELSSTCGGTYGQSQKKRDQICK